MDLSRLRFFYAIAQEGTISGAAQKVHMTQPALSRLINVFEDRINTKLFDRTPTGMRLTAQGERLYLYTKKVLEEHDAFERHFYDKEDAIEGEIRIITTPFLGAEWLMFKVENFLEQYPKLKLKIIVQENKDIYEGRNMYMEEGDIAIFFAPVYPQPHLVQKPLLSCRIKLFASPSYLEKHGTPQTVTDLDFHQLITYGGTGYNPYGNVNWVLTLGKQHDDKVRESHIEINSLQGIINAAIKGYGIAEMPNFPGVLREGLVEINFGEESPQCIVNFIFHEKRKHSKKINLLFEYLSNNG